MITFSPQVMVTLLIGTVVGVLFGYGVFAPSASVRVANACIASSNLDCMLSTLRDAYISGGAAEAFDLFDYLYKNSEEFASTGCHAHAHRIGDIAYYHDYLRHQDLSKMEFPPASAACGYGFFHGFLEHLIQDRPDPVFVDETCQYFGDHLLGSRESILGVCYHGSGHGFMLSQADRIEKGQWGEVLPLAFPPIELCESLKEATEREVSGCRKGVFTVILGWMSNGDFGLQYDKESAFSPCRALVNGRRYDCYYEMGQRMDYLSEFKARKAARISAAEADYIDPKMLMTSAAGGFVQQTHQTVPEYMDLIEDCVTVTATSLQESCVEGVAVGIMEQGPPRIQFPKTEKVCSQLDGSEAEICNKALFEALIRFFSAAERPLLCDSSHQVFREMCRKNGIYW